MDLLSLIVDNFSDGKYFSGKLANCQYPIRELADCRLRDLKAFAEEVVPTTMGTAPKNIIIDCLTFGEEDPKIEDMEQRRKDNVSFLQNQSVNFGQKILTNLKSLKLN